MKCPMGDWAGNAVRSCWLGVRAVALLEKDHDAVRLQEVQVMTSCVPQHIPEVTHLINGNMFDCL